MSVELETLLVKFEASVDGLRTQLNTVEQSFVRMEKQVERSTNKMSASLGSLGKLFKFDLLMRYGSQLMAIEERMEQLASQIRDTADRADIATDSLQKLRHAADQNGTSAEAMDSALIRLNKAMGLARSGAEGMDKIFEALGLQELIDKGATTEEVFYGLSEAVSKMSDESQASAVIARIMGREADRLIELMKNGAAPVEALAESFRGVIPEETINKLDQAADKTEEFNKILSAMGSIAAGVFVDVIKWLGETALWIDKQLDLVNQLSQAWSSLYDNVVNFGQGNLADSFNQPQVPKQKSAFVAGGRGLLEPEAAIGAPNLGSSIDMSRINPNEGKLKGLFASGDGGGEADRAREEAIRATEQYNAAVDDLMFSIEQLGRSEKEAAFQEMLRNELSSAGVTADSERGAAIASLIVQYQALMEQNEALAEQDAANAEAAQKWIDMKQEAGDAVANAFQRAIVEGESLREVLSGLLADLAQLIFQKMVFDNISNAVSGMDFGSILGGFAMGGKANAGNAYMVGESGPELFVPKVPGAIVPNRAMNGGGGGGFNYNQTINAPGADPSTLAAMKVMLAESKRDIMQTVPKIIIDKQRRNALAGAFS